MKLRFHSVQVAIKREVENLNRAPLIKLAPLMVIDKTKGMALTISLTGIFISVFLFVANQNNKVQSRDLPVPSFTQ